MAKETAIDWLVKQINQGKIEVIYSDKIHSIKCVPSIVEQAKQTENEQRKQDLKTAYNQGYMDAQCNHINDADNFANEQDYINQ